MGLFCYMMHTYISLGPSDLFSIYVIRLDLFYENFLQSFIKIIKIMKVYSQVGLFLS